jgi:hypothetical protein
VEIEKQLAAEAKKRQRLNNANRTILPESEKGRARETAAEMGGASPRYVEEAQQIAKDAPEILEHAQGSVGKQSSQHRCGKKSDTVGEKVGVSGLTAERSAFCVRVMDALEEVEMGVEGVTLCSFFALSSVMFCLDDQGGRHKLATQRRSV